MTLCQLPHTPASLSVGPAGVQPGSGRLQVQQLEAAEAAEAAARHAALHFDGVGVDAPQPSDLYYRLAVERCFYVGGMGTSCRAVTLDGADYAVGGLWWLASGSSGRGAGC